jgi:hypothetical protein
MEVLTPEDRLAAAGGLMFDAAPAVIAGIADNQAAGDYRREINHQRKIINRHAVRTNLGGPDAVPPCAVRPACRAVDAEAAMLCSSKMLH